MPPRNDPNPYNNSSLSAGGWLGIGKLSVSGAKAMGVGIAKGLYETARNPVGTAVNMGKSILDTASRVDDYAVLIQNSQGNYNTPRRQKARQEIAGKGLQDLGNLGAVIGAAKMSKTYLKNQIPAPIKNRTMTPAEEAVSYYQKVNELQRDSKRIGHPTYYSDIPFNERDQMFIKIEQIRMMNEAERFQRRADHLYENDPGVRSQKQKSIDLGKIKDPFKKPRK